jgi:carboxymethylenebutenolidase
LRGRIDDGAVMLDVEAATASLSGVLGIVGYCWGGTVAWWGATRSSSFKAAVGWYGGGIAGTRTEAPHCPVQLHFGETDGGIPLSDVELIRKAQPDLEVFVYPGAGHGFGCDERGSFNPDAAALARERTVAFLRKHL